MQKRVAILLFVLVLASCTGVQNGAQNPPSENWRTGTQGIALRYMLLPQKTFDTEEFNAVLELRNLGAFPVHGPGDRVYISGFDPSIVTGIPFTGNQLKLDAKDQFNSQGGYDTTQFKGIVRKLTTDKYPFTVLATACYDYETQASGTVCIDPDPFAPTSRVKACFASSVGLGSQAAPVAVSSIDVDARPRKTIFKIRMSNAGGGELFKYGGLFLNHCSPYDSKGLEFDDVNFVQLVDVTVSGVSIKQSCKPVDGDYIRLNSGSAEIVCEFNNIRSNAAYTTPLTVILRYGYRTQISQQVSIVKSP